MVGSHRIVADFVTLSEDLNNWPARFSDDLICVTSRRLTGVRIVSAATESTNADAPRLVRPQLQGGDESRGGRL